jgi:Arc/MetJ family transcription regulator
VVPFSMAAMTADTSPHRPGPASAPEPAPPPKVVTDVDDALLAEAQSLVGVLAENDTVNLALTRLITEQRRLAAVESQLRRFAAGQFRAVRSGAARPGEPS